MVLTLVIMIEIYATMDEQWLILIKLKQNNCILPYKNEVTFFTDVTVFDNEHKFTSAS